VPGRLGRSLNWFSNGKFSGGEPAVAGAGQEWAKTCLAAAYEMWLKYGLENGLLTRRRKTVAKMERAPPLYMKKYNITSAKSRCLSVRRSE